MEDLDPADKGDNNVTIFLQYSAISISLIHLSLTFFSQVCRWLILEDLVGIYCGILLISMIF